jgi:hypothetical protein
VDLRRCVAWSPARTSKRPATGSPPSSPPRASPCPAPSPSAPTPAASRTAAATPTRKIGGKTVTRRLSPAELTEYQPLFDNAKKLRALLAELHDLTLEIIEADSRQEP